MEMVKEGEYGQYLYESRTMKPVGIILSCGGGGLRRIMVGVNLTKVHCKHIWKCHSEIPLCN
jgi:hypothetical protein